MFNFLNNVPKTPTYEPYEKDQRANVSSNHAASTSTVVSGALQQEQQAQNELGFIPASVPVLCNEAFTEMVKDILRGLMPVQQPVESAAVTINVEPKDPPVQKISQPESVKSSKKKCKCILN